MNLNGVVTICQDLDSDCESVENKFGCWLYCVESGLCPYLYREKNDFKARTEALKEP